MKTPRSSGSRKQVSHSKPEHFPLGPHSSMVAAASVTAASIFLLCTELQESEGFRVEGT